MLQDERLSIMQVSHQYHHHEVLCKRVVSPHSGHDSIPSDEHKIARLIAHHDLPHLRPDPVGAHQQLGSHHRNSRFPGGHFEPGFHTSLAKASSIITTELKEQDLLEGLPEQEKCCLPRRRCSRGMRGPSAGRFGPEPRPPGFPGRSSTGPCTCSLAEPGSGAPSLARRGLAHFP
jgi:hypothetical protein